MSHCYRCGKPIPPESYQPRKKVRTGESLRRRKEDRPPGAVSAHFGMRVVCRRCAREIDRERRWREAVQYVELGIALFVLAIVVLSRL